MDVFLNKMKRSQKQRHDMLIYYGENADFYFMLLHLISKIFAAYTNYS